MASLPTPGGSDVWGANLNAAIESLHLTGTHAARPTTGLVVGTLYSCTDHNVVYRWSGTTWATWVPSVTITDTGQIGIGVDVPIAPLELDSGLNPDVAGTGSVILRGDTNKERFEIISVGASPSPQFQGWGGSGAKAAPQQTLANQRLFALSGSGYDNMHAKILSARALVLFISTEAFTTTAQGSRITFSTTPTGGTAVTERLRIDHDGKLGVGQTAPNSRLHTDGAIATPVRAVTATTTLTEADAILTVDATTAAVTVNLPTAVGIPGRHYTIKKIDASANAVTVDPSGTQTIDGAATSTLATRWAVLRVVSDGTNWLAV